MIELVIMEQIGIQFKGEVFNDGEYIGDFRSNDLRWVESQELKKNYKKEIYNGNKMTVEEFKKLIGLTAGLIIFKDLNGNFGKNFNETLGM
jgi:hypothetical protein